MPHRLVITFYTDTFIDTKSETLATTALYGISDSFHPFRTPARDKRVTFHMLLVDTYV